MELCAHSILKRKFIERENHNRYFYFLIEPKYGYGISRGKWLPKNKDLFSNLNIEVNFSNLGILSEDDWQQWKINMKEKQIKSENIVQSCNYYHF